jgi:hypothetical protein
VFRKREEEGRGQRGRDRGQGGSGEVIKGRKFVTKVEMRGGKEGEIPVRFMQSRNFSTIVLPDSLPS